MACQPQQLLELAKCFQCLSDKQLSMVKAYLLCQISIAPPPVLSFSFPNLHWTFSGTDPVQWSIQESEDGGASWFEADTRSGTVRSAPFLDSGVLARIVGEDALGHQIIPTSNSVAVP
jgi:hypothetical protein